MPPRTNRPCRKRGCRAITRNKNGYCDEHKTDSCGWVRSNGTKQSSSSRGYGHKWAVLRKEILKRDRFLCQNCLKKGLAVEANQVDHIKPKSLGGDNSESNLQALCIPCHKDKTSSESRLSRRTL
ncbi:HNH endonuclease [Psychromonas sp. KJ10-10]|uniref:HNH endonuclease n=1 Tax=Psychromonas sp. KJ10-10 TaxID=3391823 RepID=UPI0039B570AA